MRIATLHASLSKLPGRVVNLPISITSSHTTDSLVVESPLGLASWNRCGDTVATGELHTIHKTSVGTSSPMQNVPTCTAIAMSYSNGPALHT